MMDPVNNVHALSERAGCGKASPPCIHCTVRRCRFYEKEHTSGRLGHLVGSNGGSNTVESKRPTRTHCSSFEVAAAAPAATDGAPAAASSEDAAQE